MVFKTSSAIEYIWNTKCIHFVLEERLKVLILYQNPAFELYSQCVNNNNFRRSNRNKHLSSLQNRFNINLRTLVQNIFGNNKRNAEFLIKKKIKTGNQYSFQSGKLKIIKIYVFLLISNFSGLPN